MSHNINERKMCYYGEKPWHGIGTRLDHPATAKEAIQAAQLDYPVELQPVYTKNSSNEFTKVSGQFAPIRLDTGKSFGATVGGAYKLIQNHEAFGFFDSVVGEGQAIYHTAGALGQGERIWLLAKLPKDLVLFKDDVVEKYMCLTNSHDGKTALKVYFTPVRVVCQNTLNMSLGDASKGVSIRHSGNIQNKIGEARRVLGLALDFYNEFDQVSKSFASKQVNTKQVNTYFNDVLKVKEEDGVLNASTRTTNIKDRLVNLFENGRGTKEIPKVRGTLWAAYNAVTEYADHHATFQGADKDPSRRLKSIWFGSSRTLKTRAYDEALVLVKK